MREALRLSPTIPVNAVQAFDDTVVDGKYLIPKGQLCAILLNQLHRDPKVWGDDVSASDL